MGRLQGIILLLLVSMSTQVFAKLVYINVANVKNKKQLNYPYMELKSLGFKMSYERKSYGYAVYTGPYSSQASLDRAYKKIKRRFKHAHVIVYDSQEKQKRQEHKVQQQPKQESLKPCAKEKKDTGFVAGLSVGYGNAPSSHVLESGSVIVKEPSASGQNYSLYGGYDFANGVTLLANYMYLNTNDLEFSNYLGSLNYRFEHLGAFVPYIGCSLGYSSLKWNTSPIANASPSSNNDSAGIAYGTQIGLLYKLFQNISLKVDYSYLFLNHTTNITQGTTGRSKLQHNTLDSILIGLEYTF